MSKQFKRFATGAAVLGLIVAGTQLVGCKDSMDDDSEAGGSSAHAGSAAQAGAAGATKAGASGKAGASNGNAGAANGGEAGEMEPGGGNAGEESTAGKANGGTSGGGSAGVAGTSGGAAGNSGAGGAHAGNAGSGGSSGNAGFAGAPTGGSAGPGGTSGGTGGTSGGGSGGTSSGGSSSGGGATCGNNVKDADELCDPAFTVNNCGADCKAITSDACFTCENSPDTCQDFVDCGQLTGNAASGSPAAGVPKANLCNETLDCVRDSGCASGGNGIIKCYCGTANTNDCQNGLANGACKSQIERGLETTTFAQITQRLKSPQFGGGIAMARVDCDQQACKTDCNLQ